jgi:hypothetical protein
VIGVACVFGGTWVNSQKGVMVFSAQLGLDICLAL